MTSNLFAHSSDNEETRPRITLTRRDALQGAAAVMGGALMLPAPALANPALGFLLGRVGKRRAWRAFEWLLGKGFNWSAQKIADWWKDTHITAPGSSRQEDFHDSWCDIHCSRKCSATPSPTFKVSIEFNATLRLYFAQETTSRLRDLGTYELVRIHRENERNRDVVYAPFGERTPSTGADDTKIRDFLLRKSHEDNRPLSADVLDRIQVLYSRRMVERSGKYFRGFMVQYGDSQHERDFIITDGN